MAPPLATDFTWNIGAGNWNTSGNWSPAGTPGNGESILSTHETVSFAGAISTPSTIFTDTQATINRIRFDNTASYGIAGQGGVNLIGSTAGPLPSIAVNSGSHEFQIIRQPAGQYHGGCCQRFEIDVHQYAGSEWPDVDQVGGR